MPVTAVSVMVKRYEFPDTDEAQWGLFEQENGNHVWKPSAENPDKIKNLTFKIWSIDDSPPQVFRACCTDCKNPDNRVIISGGILTYTDHTFKEVKVSESNSDTERQAIE